MSLLPTLHEKQHASLVAKAAIGGRSDGSRGSDSCFDKSVGAEPIGVESTL